jgi:hypothetical protein
MGVFFRDAKASVFGSSYLARRKTFSLTEVPEKFYKGLKMIGRNNGSTSYAFEVDADTVRIITNDFMKRDWLTKEWGFSVGRLVEEVKPVINKWSKSDLWLFIIDMPRLYPLSKRNKEFVLTAFRALIKRGYSLRKERLDDLYNFFGGITKGGEQGSRILRLLFGVFKFIKEYDYDLEDYEFDIGLEQFKQTKDGDLVLLDPVVSTEVLDVLWKRKNGHYLKQQQAV